MIYTRFYEVFYEDSKKNFTIYRARTESIFYVYYLFVIVRICINIFQENLEIRREINSNLCEMHNESGPKRAWNAFKAIPFTFYHF